MQLGIVTISYNQADFLAQAINSVQLENRNQLAYVIIDPGSADNSQEIILDNKSLFTKIIFEPDQGPADGLNKGFALLTDADILGYLNSDDCYAPGALDYVVGFFESNPDVDVLNGAIKIMDKNGKVSPRGRTSDQFNLAMYSMSICTICQQATFFRRRAFDKIGGFNIHNKTCWDGELMVDMAIAGCHFATTDKILGYFRVYETSISGSIAGSKSLREKWLRDQHLIRKKIETTGISLYPVLIEKGYQLLYKLNLKRHISYLTAK
jgi:glycosyltransferase involved in cell wall biosynthesis